jgi:hypothetical protein
MSSAFEEQPKAEYPNVLTASVDSFESPAFLISSWQPLLDLRGPQ